ncbi:SHOCT domain-containing protein, partial [Nocardia brasiliensis]|uniref:SHOCT domain-containing protein n=1 Tax=Nocardia brasiliensis TaxID=37326 RepID=UPI003CC808DD
TPGLRTTPPVPVVPAPAGGANPGGPPVPAAGGEDLVSQLERAARLHEQGLLSDQEFADLKQRLLNPPAIPPQRPQPGTPVSTDTGRGDNRVPALC